MAKRPELLAPAGTWEALEAVVAAGADAVYLGGKRFNMRLHQNEANLDDRQLAAAVKYTRARGVRLYVTVNNLVAEDELPALRAYLRYLEAIGADAIIIQDLGLLELARELAVTIPLHASVMLNTHSEAAVRLLQAAGVSRVVLSRELTLAEAALISERTGVETEYFVHGDMCIAHSGQCYHSGVVFGASANRGRCLKPCRWPYSFLVDGAPPAAALDPGPCKLAVKDMCLFLHLPQLIQAGVAAFKIEGRMRPAAFVGRLVGLYRRAIDRYLADGCGYSPDENDWRQLQAGRVRDFATCYAFGPPGRAGIGFGGEREPRVFSQAAAEAGPNAAAALPAAWPARRLSRGQQLLAVRVAGLAALTAACEAGADIVYAGGEAFRPARPWRLADLAQAAGECKRLGASLVVATPRITTVRECGELAALFPRLAAVQAAGVLAGSPGALALAQSLTTLPVHADFSFNVFNSYAARWLQSQGAVQATISLEAPYGDIEGLAAASPLPLEVIVHGPLPAMITDCCLPQALLAPAVQGGLCRDVCQSGDFALVDAAGERHAVRVDQFCRSHIFFGRDLCLFGQLAPLLAAGISRFRIEGQHYDAAHVGRLTAAYRRELERLAAGAGPSPAPPALTGPRPLGVGVFAHQSSR